MKNVYSFNSEFPKSFYKSRCVYLSSSIVSSGSRNVKFSGVRISDIDCHKSIVVRTRDYFENINTKEIMLGYK